MERGGSLPLPDRRQPCWARSLCVCSTKRGITRKNRGSWRRETKRGVDRRTCGGVVRIVVRQCWCRVTTSDEGQLQGLGRLLEVTPPACGSDKMRCEGRRRQACRAGCSDDEMRCQPIKLASNELLDEARGPVPGQKTDDYMHMHTVAGMESRDT